MFSCHHQDSAMVLFTKVYGELSLRIQQSLPRCNNRGEFKRMPEPPSVKKRLAARKAQSKYIAWCESRLHRAGVIVRLVAQQVQDLSAVPIPDKTGGIGLSYLR
jgi:hypothetical protein